MDLVSTNPHRPGIFAFGQEAVGIVAFGQLALGVIAIGQVARGVVCIGQGAVGVFAVGQGAVGLYHATGMVALAGPRGYGIALHLLPRVTHEKPPRLPDTTPVEDLLERRIERGWLAASLSPGDDGRARLTFDPPAEVDVSLVQTALDHGLSRGCDRARVLVRAEVVTDTSGYRDAETSVRLVAEDHVVHRSRPRSFLAYGLPPKGEAGDRPTANAVVIRSIGYALVVALVLVVSLLPLAKQVLGLGVPSPIFD